MFKLLRYFSLTSLVSVVIAAALLGTFYRSVSIDNLIENGERSNVALTQVLANALRPQYMPLFDAENPQAAGERASAAKLSALHQSVLKSVSGLSVLKVKLYDLKGKTVYSSDPKQIGEDKSRNAGYLAARAGVPASELTHRGTFSAFEQTLEDLDVLSSYIPVRRDGAVEAVFEIYDDVTPLLGHVKRTQVKIVGGVILVLGLLYGVLFLIVRHADRILREQEETRKRNQEALRRSENRMRMITDNVPALIGYVDTEQRYRFVNKAYEEWFGGAGGEIPGKFMRDLLSAASYDVARPHAESVLRGERIIFEQHHAQGGRDAYLETTFVPDLDASNRVVGFYVLASDITDRKKNEERLTSLALHDALTGLANRRLFVDRLSQFIGQGRRASSRMAVLFLDLDGFKQINDTLGHDVGDLLLKEVANRLVGVVRQTDTVARFGGDEFVIALSHVAEPEVAAKVASKLIAAIARPYSLDGKVVNVTTSVGLSIGPEHGESAEALMKSADLALYEAKRAGKNVCRIAQNETRQAGADGATRWKEVAENA